MTVGGFFPTFTRKALETQAVQPSTRWTRSQVWSVLEFTASTTSFWLRAPMTVKFVPGPWRALTLLVTRYQLPATSSGGGSVGGGVVVTRVRNWAEDQPVNPSLRRTCRQVASELTPIAVTTSLNSRKPSEVKFVPGPERMCSRVAVTRYLSPVGGGGGGVSVVLVRNCVDDQPVNPSVRRRWRIHVASALNSSDSTMSFRLRSPIEAKFVPGPCRTFSEVAVTRYRSP